MAGRIAQVCCDFWFEASHVLARPDWSAAENARLFGACARLHGHSYHLQVTLRGAVDPETGMVINFSDVKEAVRERVLEPLDHEHLNDRMAELPTAENILQWIAAALLPAFGPRLHRLELWETQTASAILGPAEIEALRAERADAGGGGE